MIGVFDSGRGGLVSYRELRRLQPASDLVFLADRKNAPFGSRSPEEILALTRRGVERLASMGCDRVLIACCTASTMHSALSDELKELSLPIITPAAMECKSSRHVVVIATEHTARCGAFSKEIAKFSSASVTEVPMQPLVSAIEWGRDTDFAIREITELCRGADTLILGCTHFSHLYTELREALPEVKILSPAHIGAGEIKKITIDRGNGRDIYTCSPSEHYLHKVQTSLTK
jgi:glutamate racemase